MPRFFFEDQSVVDIEISKDEKSLLLIVQHPNPECEKVKIQIKKAEAAKFFQTLESQIAQLQ